METQLIRSAKKLLSGKSGRLADEELEYLAKEITKVGFNIRFARTYAAAPSMLEQLVHELERKEQKLADINRVLSRKK